MRGLLAPSPGRQALLSVLLLSSLISLRPAGAAEIFVGPSPLEEALRRAGENREALEEAILALQGEERRGLEFLVEHMPSADLEALSTEFLVDNVRLAYEVRRAVPWGETIPEAIFLNDVLPYASINERRDAWRPDFVRRFLPLVEDCQTAAEAAQRLNEKVFRQVGVKYSTRRRRADQSPFQSMETGLASCTGLSVLLTDACRAVGVPARLAGIPSWVNKRGNHTWVEVWDGDWHFTGAAEPSSKGLDHTWFRGDAALAKEDERRHSIWATSFRKTPDSFPMVWARNIDWVPAVNVTRRYAKKLSPEARSRLLIRVLEHPGGCRVEAPVELSVFGKKGEAKRAQSKGESADLNDILAFPVEPKSSYRVEVGGKSRVVEAKAGDEILTIYLDEKKEGAAPAPAPGLNPAPAAKGATTDASAEVLAPPGLSLEDRRRVLEAAAAWFAAGPLDREGLDFASLDALLRGNEASVRDLLWKAYRRLPSHESLRADFDEKRVRAGGHESPYTLKPVGKRPEGGWPLFIAMHGGGGVPKRVNDSQWRHMQVYYKDHAELGGYQYLALRAPNDRWNGFYDNYVWPLIEKLVRQMVLLGDVHPDRVFALGYSHGGYGAFAIGPKIPHRFAAVHASAAAPTGGLTFAKNLRNTRFTYMIGERDLAYGRLERCRKFAAEIDQLRGERQDIYPVHLEFQAGYGHGGLPDRDKIVDLYPHRRNAAPRELSWQLSDTVVKDFFWLHVEDPQPGQAVEVRRGKAKGPGAELLEVALHGRKSVTLYLDERLVDYGKDSLHVKLTVDGQEVAFHTLSPPRPRFRTLLETLEARGDIGLAHSIAVELAEKDPLDGPLLDEERLQK